MHTFLHRFRYYRSKGYTNDQIRVKLDHGDLNAAVLREQKQLNNENNI